MKRQEYLDKVNDELGSTFDLVEKKSFDYGGDDPLSNFRGAEAYGLNPFLGLALRMDDKFKRVQSYCRRGELSADNEGIRDALRDIIGYAVNGLALLDESVDDTNRR